MTQPTPPTDQPVDSTDDWTTVHPEPTPPTPDRSGYTVTEQSGTDLRGNPIQTTWSIVRDSTGTGLGAYANQADIDLVISNDRAANPPVNNTPTPQVADGPANTTPEPSDSPA